MTRRTTADELGRGLRWRLSILWVLEWGITGTILTYLPLYLAEIGLTPGQTGQLLAVSAIGLWVAPFIVGQVADRWMPSEKYLAISHFVGGITLVMIPFASEIYRETRGNFSVLLMLFGLYAVAYFPTMPLASSLTFRHLPDPDAQFGKVRIWGTVGWMLAGFGLSCWLGQNEVFAWTAATFPGSSDAVSELRNALYWLPEPSSSDCFRIGAILSFMLSSFCIFLPPTPPARTGDKGIAPLQILAMFRIRAFSLLIGISFLLSLVIPLYTLQVPKLLEQHGFASDWIPAVMLIGQISEFPALLLLPMFLKRFGLKGTFAIGIAAWLVRYVMFAFEEPSWVILLGLAFHGICHVFLIIVVQLYVDSHCRRDLRASAQNLFAFITMGVGMPLGALLAGELGQLCLNEATGQTNYQTLFAIPAAILLVLLIVFCRWISLDTPNGDSEDSDGVTSETATSETATSETATSETATDAAEPASADQRS